MRDLRISRVLHALRVGVLVVAVGCGGKSATPFRDLDSTSGHIVPSEPKIAAHALQGVLVRDAVVRGDLRSTREAANGLVDLVVKNEQPPPESRLEAMVLAARRVGAAEDLDAAARSFAVLAERCGECHAQIGGPTSGPATPPPPALGVVPRMRRHQWGAARLWEGMVAPSAEAWSSGAEVLTDAPLGAETLPDRTAVPEVAALSTAVHDLGVEATRATRASARMAVYGKLLTTCAACHARVGGGPR